MVTDEDIKRFKRLTEIKLCKTCKNTKCTYDRNMHQACNRYKE